jgi:hypothetical protein
MARYRKYKVCIDYFDRWSREMAYILGFVSADGYVRDNGLTVDVANRDLAVVEFIRDEISPNKQIEDRHKGNSKSIRIHSVELSNSLNRFGLTSNKSHTIKLDFDIPEEFFGDYIRGVFDGDGWVYCRRNQIESGICSGSEPFLEEIRRRCGFGRKVRAKTKKGYKNKLYQWDLGTNASIELRELMYKRGGFCLQRKRDIFYSNWHIPSAKFWTDEQLALLIDNWKAPLKEMPHIIGKSYKSISKKKWKLRQDKDPRIISLEKEVDHG